jgi:hypothetical protein
MGFTSPHPSLARRDQHGLHIYQQAGRNLADIEVLSPDAHGLPTDGGSVHARSVETKQRMKLH